MVNASNADEFRAIVQELTGRNSGVGEPSNVPTTLAEEANQVDSPPAKVYDKSLLDTFRDSDVGEPSNVPTTLPEEANHVHSPFQVDSPPAKVVDKNLLDTFQDDMSSLEFDEGFLWRGVPENLFGFQSPFIFV
ncbi:VQ - like 10 [Theobroma cacao]|nr:VQ - like 10 [Theobroma cacao]